MAHIKLGVGCTVNMSKLLSDHNLMEEQRTHSMTNFNPTEDGMVHWQKSNLIAFDIISNSVQQ